MTGDDSPPAEAVPDARATTDASNAHATMDEAAPPIAELVDVSHRFGDLSALESVSLSLEPGTVTALVGPNGCGKTTLLRIVAGVLDQTAGRVDRPDIPRPVGYLPQRPDFRPAFTVRETLSFYASLLPEAIDVTGALEDVGMLAVADRRVDGLSGGMRRLLGLAQATLGDPPLVLLDEPTGDLDPRMTEYMFDVIMQGERDAAVLLATHNLSGADDADRVVVMDRGRVVADGDPADLVDETGTDDFRAAFLEIVGSDPTIGVRREDEP